ncbi:hypothetical protein EAE96_007005 [Botrytis aclada]|nr:hypothetical protein EAE96_007005 [Botrytis aclada]
MFKFGSKTRPAGSSEKIHFFLKLGDREAYQLALHTLDRHRNKSIICRYTIPQSYLSYSNRLIRIVETAIIEVLLLHPILQARIIDAESQIPAWKQLHHLNLDDHFTWRILQAPEDFEDVSRELIISEIDGKFHEIEEKPGWRIVVLYQERINLLEIHFTWDQTYGDGIGGRIFQEDLSRCLNMATRNENIEDNTTTSSLITLPPSQNMPPPIEELYKSPFSLSLLAKNLWKTFAPAAISRKKSNLANWAPIHAIPYSTQHRSFYISRSTLHDIHLACRKKNSTLTSLLHALMTISLSPQIDENTASAFQSRSTLNMRKFITSIPKSNYPEINFERIMGNYEESVSHKFDKNLIAQLRDKLPGDGNRDLLLSPGQLRQIWRIGAGVRGEIEQKVARGLKKDSLEAMRCMGNWRQRLENASKRPRKFSWSITDAGTFDENPKIDSESHISSAKADPEGKNTWILHRAGYVSSAETTGAAFVISLMSIKGAGLSVGVSWQGCVCGVEMGERVADDLKKWLEQIAEEAYP